MDLRPSALCHDSGPMVLWVETFKMSLFESIRARFHLFLCLTRWFLKSGRNPPISGSHPVSLSSGFATWMPLAATTWGISGSSFKSTGGFLPNSQYSRFGAIERYPICLKFQLEFVESPKLPGMFGCVRHTYRDHVFQSHIVRGLVERGV